MIDLTTLEGADTPGKVRALCAKARPPDPADPTLPPVAAVCVYPDMVADREGGRSAAPACTSQPWPPRSRPAGRASTSSSQDTRDAVAAGADEIDMVIDRGAFLSGRYLRGATTRSSPSEGVPARADGAHLKVILETGELVTYDNVRRASWLAMLAGADFIKTSHRQGPAGRDAAGDAGDARGGPRLPRRHRPAGRRQAGRRHPQRKDAIKYLVMVNETAGDDWLEPGLVPLRRLQPAQRPADAAHQAARPAATPAPTTSPSTRPSDA